MQRVRELFWIKIGNGLRELEQLVECGLHRLFAFQLRQRGDQTVERKPQTLSAAGLEIL